MFGRVISFFGKRKETKDDIEERQSDWITAQMHDWQLAWHDLFDADPVLKETGSEFKRPYLIPEDDEDFRLCFGISRVTPETRRACFALFPNGKEMFRRFESYLQSKDVDLNVEEARALGSRLAKTLSKRKFEETLNLNVIKVLEEDGESDMLGDEISHLFGDEFLEQDKEEKSPAVAAVLFLADPLYHSSGEDVVLENWVTAAMSDRTKDRCMTHVYELWRGGWQVCAGEEGVELLRDRPWIE